MDNLRRLIREIHRRSLWQVLGIYLVSGWVAYQVVESLTDGLGLPAWLPAAAVVLLVAGLPIVLATAFVEEGATDREVHRGGGPPSHDDRARSAGPAGPRLLSWRNTLMAGTVAAALWGLVAAGWLLLGHGTAGPATTAAVSPETAPTAGAGLDPARVAVLYFDDLSPTGDLEYLAVGFTEALIHELSQVDRLQVISRNGVKPYHGADATIDSIARALAVGTLVEGSLEPGSGGLRATVQLVDGATGAHLLSRRVEVQGADLLALRDDIVREVTGLLRQRLGETIRLRERKAAAENDESWDLVQRAERLLDDATALFGAGETGAATRTIVQADSLLAEAARRAPRWPLPRTLQGLVAARRGEWALDRGDDAAARDTAGALYGEALEHLDRALILDPGDALALTVRGRTLWSRFLFLESAGADSVADRAEQDLRKAVANPSQARAEAWSALSSLLQYTGRFVEARQAAERAYDADPFLLDAQEVLLRLCSTTMELGEYDGARRYCAEGRRRFPGVPDFVDVFLILLAADPQEGTPDSAWHLVDLHLGLVSPADRPYTSAQDHLLAASVLAALGLRDSAIAVVDRVRAVGPSDERLNYPMAWASIKLGWRDSAVAHLRRFTAAYPAMRPYVARDLAWRELRDDPRFEALVDSM